MAGLLEVGISDAISEYLRKPTCYIRAEEFNSINDLQLRRRRRAPADHDSMTTCIVAPGGQTSGRLDLGASHTGVMSLSVASGSLQKAQLDVAELTADTSFRLPG